MKEDKTIKSKWVTPMIKRLKFNKTLGIGSTEFEEGFGSPSPTS